MATYIYAEKNGNASMTLSAEDEDAAYAYLTELVRQPYGWRLEDTKEE